MLPAFFRSIFWTWFFSGSQTDPCFQNKNSGCRLTGQLFLHQLVWLWQSLNIEYLFLYFCLSHRMQNFLRLDWPSVQRRKQWLLLIKWIKLKEKEIYQDSTSRSGYLYSITRIVALTQRRKMRDRPKVIVRRNGHEQWLAGPFLKTDLRRRRP